MTDIIRGIHAQPLFPTEDLSETNANILELMLSNDDFVDYGHIGMEQLSWTYRVGHAAVVNSSRRIHESTPLGAIDSGAALFEAMAMAVTSEFSMAASSFIVNKVAVDLYYIRDDAQLIDHTLQAVEQFKQDLPLASEVVLEASRRRFQQHRHYALLGAAIERQFTLDVSGDVET